MTWWKVLLGGSALWIAVAIVTAATENVNLVPTLVLVGSFLVPFTVAIFVVEHLHGTVDGQGVLLAFFVGGVFGVLGASVLEVGLRPSPWMYLGVGAIEEFVKFAILVFVGWRVAPKDGRLGAFLGAVVGAGFAAFESAGYAFTAGLTVRGVDLGAILQTEALRALLTPVGHVLWTAVLGAALFSAAKGGVRYRFALRVPIAFVVVAVLHAAWDSMGAIATWAALTVAGQDFPELTYGQLWVGDQDQVRTLQTGFYVAGLVVVSVLGVIALGIWNHRAAPSARVGRGRKRATA